MALPREQLTHLRVIDGGSARMRREELHIEVLTFFSEVERAAEVITDAECGLPVVSHRVINEASKLAHRAASVRREWNALRGPDPDAA